MNADAEKKERIFNAAVELSGAAERQAFLEAACGQDDELRSEIEELLKHDAEAGSLLRSGAATRALEVTSDSKSVTAGIDKQIGPYRLLQEIGEGGFGVVYMAEQQQPVRRKVAVKIIKPGMDTREVNARFEAERQALAMMEHPNIARVLDVGATESGRPYFVMELVKGVPITQYCDKNTMTLRERLELFVVVCRAIQHAHQKGIIHRDIKPSNVMVTLRDGQPVAKVIDFGVSKAINQQLTEKTLFTRYGQMVGTPQYMSPEQAEMSELDIDTRSDVYSLGVLLYELLTGTTPLMPDRLKDQGYAEMQRIICDDEPQTPSTRLSSLGDELTIVARHRHSDRHKLNQQVRGELDWIVMKALDKERSRRYETANSFAADVQAYLSDDPVLACPPSTGYKLAKTYRKHRRILNTIAAIFLILVAATAVSSGLAIVAFNAQTKAEDASNKATQAGVLLQEERDRATREAYAGHIFRAQTELEKNNAAQAMVSLNRCPEELRHWEWNWLRYQSDQSRILASGLDQLFVALFSPDGKQILSGQKDGTYQFWDTATKTKLGAPLRMGPTLALMDTKYVSSVQMPAFSPDGALVATSDANSIVLWDTSTHEEIKKTPNLTALAFHIAENEGEITSVQALVNQSPVRIVDVMTGRETNLEEDFPHVALAAFSADGTTVATCDHVSFYGHIREWDTASGQKRKEHEDGSLKLALSYSQAGTRLVAAGDEQVQILDTATQKNESTLRGHIGVVTSAAFSGDGRQVVSGGEDSTLRMWDVESGEAVATYLGQSDRVRSARFSPNNQQLVSTSDDETIRLWEVEEAAEVKSFDLKGHGVQLRGLAFNPSGSDLVSTGFDNAARVWDVKTGKEKLTLRGHSGYVLAGVFSPDGNQIITSSYSSYDGEVKRWDAHTGSCLGNLAGVLKRGVYWVAYSPDGSRIAAAGEDGIVQLWDSEDGAAIHNFPVRLANVPQKTVNGLAFSPDGKKIATCGIGQSDAVLVFDAATGKLDKSLRGPLLEISMRCVQPGRHKTRHRLP